MRLSAGVSSTARGTLAIAFAAAALAGFATPASASSLYSGPGPRPGPAILYETPAVAPELTNTGIWDAPPILISGTTAYRDGEFLYQDYLYDDHGAREVLDPTDPRASGDTFSKPNGTYTYPTGPGYNNDAADLVEFRVKPTTSYTAFRITLNTLENPSLIAFSIAIGGEPGQTFAFPDGANVVAPASLFLTVHPSGSKLVTDLVHAGSDTPVTGPAPTVTVDTYRRQIEVDVPHQDWNPGQSTVRMAMGVGLWNAATGKYLLPARRPPRPNPAAPASPPTPQRFSTWPSERQSHSPRRRPRPGRSSTPPGGETSSKGPRSLRATSPSSMPTSTSPSFSAASPTTRTSRPRVRWTGSSPATLSPRKAPTSRTNAAWREPRSRQPASPSIRATCSHSRSTYRPAPRPPAATG